MSGSAPDVNRDQLETKDREQLVAIATALGKKPPSRAKKADIVDLILELTSSGADALDSPGSSGGELASAKPANEPAKARRGGGRRGASDSDATTEATKNEGDEAKDEAKDAASPKELTSGTKDGRNDAAVATRPSTRGSEGSNENGRTRAPRAASSSSADSKNGSTGRGENGNGKGNSKGNDADADARGSSSQSGSGKNDRTGGDDDSRAENAGQNDPANQGGQGEPGNRRRRRRGRDRAQGQTQEPVFEGEPVEVEGILDLRDDGYGFLRLHGYLPHRDDSYVSVKQVRQFGLRKGDKLKGHSRPPTRSEKNPALLRIDEVNEKDPVLARERPDFDELTPLYPDEQLRLEHRDTIVDMTPRIIDLLAPIGKGQRGLIVSPPKAGKTSIMKTIARAIEQNNPEVHLMVLLVDERPEEVTDFQRWVRDGEVAASTFDRPTEEHTVIAELVIERAKRIVEEGGDVVILVDGITRLARAYNLTVPASGRVMSGGIDAAALYPPKKFFGAARNVEDGGSLTILATALVDTNSRMDDHIFEEFKGTGNMELRLDRRLAEQRIFPAIDVEGSSTRHEELLFSKAQLAQVWKLRRVLSGVSSSGGGTNAAALELLVERMQAFKSNEAFLAEVAKTAN